MIGLLLVTGCGEEGREKPNTDTGAPDAGRPYIKPFTSGTLELLLGQTGAVVVELSHPVTEITYVDAHYPDGPNDAIRLDASTLKFKTGERQKTVHITGLKSTAGAFIDILFRIRLFGDGERLRVIVSDSIWPDSSLPDWGPTD